ncbi:pentapeptide repeat-containing protein [Actinomadura litoris]|uniref:Pentapeptide repeat-containing protein n=1 Tax=Actinomadura litoris TaxID=2678616 RepID=A0A7K1LB83_9ACTN|nr:pentapeptide repeat-containing protein [Actinomadura litoris]MUN41684.1 hypothetical protein [Actinomadura litoris]
MGTAGGKIAEAVHGAMGSSQRKGASRTWNDVADRTADVILLVMSLLKRLSLDGEQIFAARLASVAERSGAPPVRCTTTHEDGSGAPHSIRSPGGQRPAPRCGISQEPCPLHRPGACAPGRPARASTSCAQRSGGPFRSIRRNRPLHAMASRRTADMATTIPTRCPKESLRPSASPEELCGAAPVVDGHCLAHLSSDQLQAYLANLATGADIHTRNVVFTSDLLQRLLRAVAGRSSELGKADFRGATFSERVSFREATFTGHTNFRGATFCEDTDFGNVTFTGHTDFRGATFTKDTDFGNVTFTGHTDFRGATFTKDTNFSDAFFYEHADFGGATFTKDTNFSDVTFTEDASFSSAAFTGHASFRDATFTKNADFSGGRVEGRAEMVGCAASGLVWARARIAGELVVEAAAARVDLSGVRASGRVGLRLRGARVDLSEAVFTGPVTVHGLQTAIAGVDETTIAWEGTEPGGPAPRVKMVSLRNADAERLVLTDVDLSECRFAGMQQLEKITLDGRCRLATDPRGTRQVLAEEHHWRAARPRPRPRKTRLATRWRAAPDGVAVVDAARLEVLYRQLRKALEDSKNEPGAADFYYGEMQMRRHSGRGFAERALVWTYWLVAGYGLRAWRAIAALAVLVALVAVAVKYAGFPGEPVPYIDALLYSLRSAFLINVKSAHVPETVTRWGEVFRIVLRITVPLLLGLAGLAIRNRVKR